MDRSQSPSTASQVETVEFSIVTLPPLKALGQSKRIPALPLFTFPVSNPIPRLWADSFRGGMLASLQNHPARRFPDCLVGRIGEVHPDGSYRYVAGILADEDAWVPGDCTAGDVPGGEYARLTVRGREPAILFEGQTLLDRRILDIGRVPHPHTTRMEWYGPQYAEHSGIHLVQLLRLLSPEVLATAEPAGRAGAHRSP